MLSYNTQILCHNTRSCLVIPLAWYSRWNSVFRLYVAKLTKYRKFFSSNSYPWTLHHHMTLFLLNIPMPNFNLFNMCSFIRSRSYSFEVLFALLLYKENHGTNFFPYLKYYLNHYKITYMLIQRNYTFKHYLSIKF